MGNSVFKIMLAVPNAMEEDEATTAVDEADLAALQKDQEMADGNAAPGEEALDGHEEVPSSQHALGGGQSLTYSLESLTYGANR